MSFKTFHNYEDPDLRPKRGSYILRQRKFTFESFDNFQADHKIACINNSSTMVWIRTLLSINSHFTTREAEMTYPIKDPFMYHSRLTTTGDGKTILEFFSNIFVLSALTWR